MWKYSCRKVLKPTRTFAHKNTDTTGSRSTFWPCHTPLLSPQTIALHQELHPHASICVLHAKSYKYFRERCCALLWIGLRQHGKSHSGRPQVHHRSTTSPQNPVCKYTPLEKVNIKCLLWKPYKEQEVWKRTLQSSCLLWAITQQWLLTKITPERSIISTSINPIYFQKWKTKIKTIDLGLH